MKKNLKLILISTILATNTIFATACSNSKDTSKVESNNEKGGYLETDIALPDEIAYVQNMFYIDNNISLIAKTRESKFKNFAMQQDGTFAQKELSQSLIKILESDNMNQMVMDIAYISDSNYVTLVSDYENNKTIMKIIEGENTKDIELGNNNYNYLKIYNNEIFLLDISQNSVINRYDLQGNLLKSYNVGTGQYTIANNEIISLNPQEKSIIIYDLETGEEKQSISKQDLDFSSNLSVDVNGNIYICSKVGIEKLLKDNGTFEKLVDGNITSLGMPTTSFKNFVAINENEYYSLFYGTEGMNLSKYTYEEDYNSKFTTSLNVYMLQDNPFIKQAIFNYKKANPTVNINIQIGYDEHNGITKEDAIKNLNTEILSGKGADIFILDGLNIDNYVEKGALLDISDLVMPLVDNGELLENVVNPFIKDGKIYAIPTRFSPSIILGTNEILNNYTGLDSLAKWQQENPDKMMFYPRKPEKLIEKTFKTNTQILNEDGTLNESELKKYLENIKLLSSDKDTGAKIEDEFDEYIANLEYLAYKDTQATLEDIKVESEFENAHISIGMNGNATYKVNNEYFTPLNIIGINAKSKNIDIAKDIIKIALNEETQKLNLLSQDGFTINRKVFDSFKQIEEKTGVMAAKTIMLVNIHPDKRLDFRENLSEDEDRVKFYETIEKVSKPAKEDTILMNFIIEESKGYFKGEKDIEQTTKVILQKANTYLSE